MREAIVRADVLCVGGGIAGLMAAIRAAETGAKVVLAEKGNTLRSGSGATGNDHFRAYIPEFHGPDMEAVVEEVFHSQAGWTRPKGFVRLWMERSFDIVKLWDSWGIPMRTNGKWEFAGHTFPGGTFTTLKYSGQNQKLILTREAKKRGVEIINRVMILDLLCDRAVTGAIGVDTREEQVYLLLAKSVILTTGGCVRLYPGPTPGWMFNRADSPHTTGDGRAMAYRAGAELVNLEIPTRWAGPKYFARCGKGTWVGVLRDAQNKPVGPFVEKPDRRYGDPISDTYKSVFEEYGRSGKGPVYMDCRGISDEDYEYMMHWMNHEGNSAVVDHLRKEGIDLKKNPVEFMTYEMTTRGGILYNQRGETSVKGLYAAGDEYFGGISCAAVFGWIAGENAAHYSRNTEILEKESPRGEIEAKKEMLERIRSRRMGASWQEVNVALQQIMLDYAGSLRYESMLRAGRQQLIKVKEKALESLMARNPHELMHCFEALNLLDIGELIFLSVFERKETREKYSRLDYPFTNPMFNGKVLVCKRVDGSPVVEWKEIK